MARVGAGFVFQITRLSSSMHCKTEKFHVHVHVGAVDLWLVICTFSTRGQMDGAPCFNSVQLQCQKINYYTTRALSTSDPSEKQCKY